MAKEADAHAAEDKAKRDEIESRNQLDSMVYNVEKMLREHGDKISAADKSDVESALNDAKRALDSNNKSDMDQAREKLTTASHKLAEVMYRAAQPQGAPGAGPEQGAPPGDGAGAGGQHQTKEEGVIDAEYVDVEDKK